MPKFSTLNSLRKEEIEKAAHREADGMVFEGALYSGFIAGAEWADSNGPLLTVNDFKKELEGKPIIWPQAWQEITDAANKLIKEKQCK